MIRVGKKEALYGYIDIIVAQLANIIVLPIILNRVNTEEYALWNVFVSIQAFVILFESGFAVLIARFTTYAISGAETIPKIGRPTIIEGFVNYNLLYAILVVAKEIYIKISILASTILLLATGYIYYIARGLPDILGIIVAWAVFSIGIALSLYFTYYTSFLKGAGRIKEMRIISISSNIIQALLKIVLIVAGFGLLGISLAVTAVIVYRRLLIRKHVFMIFKNQSEKCFEIRNETKLQLLEALRINAKQLGAVVVAQYIENQGTTLICSVFLPLGIIGKYGLTLQILSVISSVASIPTSTFQPVLNQAVVQTDNRWAQYIYSVLTVIISTSYWIGIVLAFFFVPKLLFIIKSKTSLLGGYIFLLMAFYQFEIIMHQRATKLISYSNDQRYVRSYVATAICELLCAGFALKICNGSILIYVILLVAVELYNFVVWPVKACELIGFHVKTSYIEGVKSICQYIPLLIRSKLWRQKN